MVEVFMSEVKVSKKKAAAPQRGPLSELLAPVASLVTAPLGVMREVAEGMDHAFGITAGAQAGCWTPAIDLEQYQGRLMVTVELPGLKKEDVKIELTDGSLVIKGEHHQEHKTYDKGMHIEERRYGQFYRSVPLPEGAKTNQMKVALHNGVLQISMPVTEKNTSAAA
jgi:HSP20 family protein